MTLTAVLASTLCAVLALTLCSASSVLVAFQKLSATTGMPSGFTLDNGDFFGSSVASLGDLDSDGVPDLAVGAYGGNDGGTDTGAVYVVLMNADGSGKTFQKLSARAGFPFLGFTLDVGDNFGMSITNLGDLDSDGVPDLAVGAYGDDDGGSNTGAVYVVFMKADGSGKAFQKLSATTGMPSGFTLGNGDRFGTSVASLGDLDSDGVPDLAVGAFGDDDGGSNTGAVYVVFMKADGVGKAFQKLSTTTGMPSAFTLGVYQVFGSSVASLGDLNGDGVPDLAVGAYGDDDGGSGTGAVYVVLMNADGSGKAFQKLSATTGMPSGFTLGNGDSFGSSVASLGDLDGDGVPDLAVGAYGYDDSGSGTGAVYVVLMNADGSGKAFQKLSAATGMPSGFTLGNRDSFGSSVTSLGDLDGDGVPDLAVGALRDDDGGRDKGAVYVFQLNVPSDAGACFYGSGGVCCTAGEGDWQTCLSNCQGYGVVLACPSSTTNNDAINAQCGAGWIGPNDIDTEGEFQCAEDSVSLAAIGSATWNGDDGNGIPTEPNGETAENCVEISGGFWNDLSCTAHTRVCICAPTPTPAPVPAPTFKPVSAPTSKPVPAPTLSPIADSGNAGSCFHASGAATLESGASRKMSELSLGDVVQIADEDGKLSFSQVLFLPHKENDELATFLNLTTESGKNTLMTGDHLIPRCDETVILSMASELSVGDCLLTVDGKETLIEITPVVANGIYTAVTKAKFVVVDGIVASPFSRDSDREHSMREYEEFRIVLENEQKLELDKAERKLQGTATKRLATGK